jgi:hypothetical protein
MNTYYNINNGVIKNNQKVFVMCKGFGLGKLTTFACGSTLVMAHDIF